MPAYNLEYSTVITLTQNLRLTIPVTLDTGTLTLPLTVQLGCRRTAIQAVEWRAEANAGCN